MLYVPSELNTFGKRMEFLCSMFYAGNVSQFSKDIGMTHTRLARWFKEEQPEIPIGVMNRLHEKGFRLEWLMVNSGSMFNDTSSGKELESALQLRMNALQRLMNVNEKKGIYRASLDED